MKHSEYNNDQIAQKFRLPEDVVMPILSATPTILTHAIQPSDSFLIFASDGLWEHLSNEEAVEIVHTNPRAVRHSFNFVFTFDSHALSILGYHLF